MPKSRRAIARALDAWSKGHMDFSTYLAPELKSDVAASRRSAGVDAAEALLRQARARRDPPEVASRARDDDVAIVEPLEYDENVVVDAHAVVVETDDVDCADVEPAESSDVVDEDAKVEDDESERVDDPPPHDFFEEPPIDLVAQAAERAEREASRRKAARLRRIRELLAERRWRSGNDETEPSATASQTTADDDGNSARGGYESQVASAALHRVKTLLRERRAPSMTKNEPTLTKSKSVSIAERLAALKVKQRE
jgi:hypothetical protein